MQANNIVKFAEILHSFIIKETKKPVWAEKTPSNIYLTDIFVKCFPDAKIIHIVRDPRDVILSLMQRGHSEMTAASVWLTSVACIQKIRAHPNLLEIRYEDLIIETEKTLQKMKSQHLS